MPINLEIEIFIFLVSYVNVVLLGFLTFTCDKLFSHYMCLTLISIYCLACCRSYHQPQLQLLLSISAHPPVIRDAATPDKDDAEDNDNANPDEGRRRDAQERRRDAEADAKKVDATSVNRSVRMLL